MQNPGSIDLATAVGMATRAVPDAARLHGARQDGRRERSADSRRRILAAMVDIVESGVPMPTAEAIAARAGVSLRTVFRHFEEMENLYLEIAAVVFDRVRLFIERPFVARAWPDVLHEAIDRRAAFFEMISPFKTAIDIYRHRSRAVAAQHRRINAMSQDLLVAVLPAEIFADHERAELVTMLLSIETWQRLRDQQGLTVAEARSALVRACEALLLGVMVNGTAHR